MKWLIQWTGLWLTLLVLVACGQIEVGVEGTATAVLPPPILATPTLAIQSDYTVATATAVPLLTSTPQQIINPNEPFRFTNLRFAANNQVQDKFAAGTEEVFAWWDYQDMDANAIVKRVWQLNGQEWLVREEPWDVAKYGAVGTVTDISIFDFEGSGLTPGVYSLALYLDGVLQVQRSFTVMLPETAVSYPDPTGNKHVAVWGGLLFRQLDSNDLQFLAQGQEISEVVWSPDSSLLFYVEVDRSQQVGDNTLGIQHALWSLDVTGTGNPIQLGSFTDDLHSPQISPNGRFVALLKGTGYGDACFVDTILHIMEVDAAGQKTALYTLADFLGAPRSDTYWIYPTAIQWNADNRLIVHLDMFCYDATTAPPADALLRGVYRLDMDTHQATRLSDLP